MAARKKETDGTTAARPEKTILQKAEVIVKLLNSCADDDELDRVMTIVNAAKKPAAPKTVLVSDRAPEHASKHTHDADAS